MSKDSLKKIYDNFQTEGIFLSCIRYGSGHIHDTYIIRTHGNESNDYILQKINHNVFRNVEELQENIRKITMQLTFLCSKNEKSLKLIPAKNKKSFYLDKNNNYWRIYEFIENSKVYERITDTDIAFEGGKAYGNFIKKLYNFPVDELYETIPQFHDIYFRFANFESAVKKNSERLKKCSDEINFTRIRKKNITLIQDHYNKKEIKQIVTHNDTKINNVLFNIITKKAICVIDLDTVMKGCLHYDYGDAIRTFANTAIEDEKDINRVELNIETFKAFSKGFVKEINEYLSALDVKLLPEAARLMCFIMGIRFLTDYLENDIYYKTDYPGHNLVRCRVQYKMVECIEKRMPLLNEIVAKLANTYK